MVSRARGSYSRLANGYAQLEVNRRNEELLGQFVKISETRYETGAATQSDVLIAQTDLAKLLETRADIQRQISEEQSALNVLMNRPAQAPLGQPAPLVFVAHEFSLERASSHDPGAPARDATCAEYDRSGEVPARTGESPVRFPDPMLNFKAQRYNDASQVVSELDIGISIPLPGLTGKSMPPELSNHRRAWRTHGANPTRRGRRHLAWCETSSRKPRPLPANTSSIRTKFSRLRAKLSMRARQLTNEHGRLFGVNHRQAYSAGG